MKKIIRLTEGDIHKIINEVLNYLNEESKREFNYIDVKRKFKYPSVIEGARFSQHWIRDRKDRAEIYREMRRAPGRPVFSFLADTGQPGGLEIHSLLDNGFICIQNANTKIIVTFFIPSYNEITRYWEDLRIPVPINDRNFQNVKDNARINRPEYKKRAIAKGLDRSLW